MTPIVSATIEIDGTSISHIFNFCTSSMYFFRESCIILHWNYFFCHTLRRGSPYCLSFIDFPKFEGEHFLYKSQIIYYKFLHLCKHRNMLILRIIPCPHTFFLYMYFNLHYVVKYRILIKFSALMLKLPVLFMIGCRYIRRFESSLLIGRHLHLF